MAADNEIDIVIATGNSDLAVIDAAGIFPRNTAWIGFRRNQALRLYKMDFIKLFARHIEHKQLQSISQAENQQDIDSIFRHVRLPIRNGRTNGMFVAALLAAAYRLAQ